MSNPIIEHVTVVTHPGWSTWVNPTVTVVGVLLTAWFTWMIAKKNLSQAEASAAAEQERHEAELDRLRAESEKTEARHSKQIEMMFKLGRMEREVRFLRDLSDHLVAFASFVREADGQVGDRSILSLNQYSLKAYADFAEDDPAFTYNLSYFVTDLARRTEEVMPQNGGDGDVESVNDVGRRAEEGAALMLKWLNPQIRQDVTEKFEHYRTHGTFDLRETDG